MASIPNAVRKDKAGVSLVYVEAKISGIRPELVPLISRFANSKNEVNEADFKRCRIAHTQGGPKEVTRDTALVVLDLRMSPALFEFEWFVT